MLQLTFTYPFDPNGTAPSNLITRELHTIAPDVGRVYNFLIPRAAPFFGASMQIKNVSTGNFLVKNIDFVCTHAFEAASNTEPYLPVYGSVLLTNTGFTGQLELTYQTLGGEYTLSEQQLLTTIVNATLDPRVTTWESVADKPYVYAPIDHTHHADTLVGMDEVVTAIYAIANNLATGTDAINNAIAAHKLDANAHSQYALAADIQGLLENVLAGNSTGVAAGGANSIELAQPGSTTVTEYSQGLLLTFEATVTNTSTVQLQIVNPPPTANLPLVPLLKNGNEQLIPGDVIAGRTYLVIYDQNSSCFQLINPSGLISASSTYARFVATAGQTVFKVPYIPGSVKIRRDSVAVPTGAFVATDGSTITLSLGVPVNTLIEITGEYDLTRWRTVATGSTLVSGIRFVPDNSTGACTYKLPFNPVDGASVEWIAGTVPFSTNQMSLVADDKPIMGTYPSVEVTTDGTCGRLTYSSTLGYWRAVATGQSGFPV